MRTREEVATVQELVQAGLNDCERPGSLATAAESDGVVRSAAACRRTSHIWRTPTSSACTSATAASPPTRGVYRLRISCASAYPDLIRQCEEAITEVLPVKVNRITRQGCFEVYSFSKHWICLFPQHGPGHKHERKIELTGWQQDLVDLDPPPLLRGLLHSDGCRVLNW